jgi:hypothetical protein
MPTVKGLSAWGIRLGEDFALSEQGYKVGVTKSGDHFVQMGDQHIPYERDYQKEFFIEEIKKSERRAGKSHGMSLIYPLIAGSGGLTEYYERKYDFNSTLVTWLEANASAAAAGGRLLTIESEQEQTFIYNELKLLARDGFHPSSGDRVNYAWIGATDDDSQFAVNWVDQEQNYTTIPIGSTGEGDWRWVFEGTEISSGFQNWLGGGNGPSNITYDVQDFAAIDWGSTGGHWIDLNESYNLPFIVEYDDVSQPAPLSIAVNGYRKVLVVPARFQDEGYSYNGSSVPLVDQFGEPLFPELQQDSFEPVSNADLQKIMEEVKDFFLRNSDNSFHLEPVISPTVTMEVNKFSKIRTNEIQTENRFDTDGGYFYYFEEFHDELTDLAPPALQKASEVGDDYHFNGPAFHGVMDFEFSGPLNTTFEQPPVVSITGGNKNPATGLVHPNFKNAEVEAILDESGRLVTLQITDPGAYYYTEPQIFLNDQNFTDDDVIADDVSIRVIIGDIGVSYVLITTYNSLLLEPNVNYVFPIYGGGVGWVGAPGAHVSVGWDTDNVNGENLIKNVPSAGVIAHELGHNFNMHHSNTYLSLSEHPNSDEVLKHEYNNPHSVMGDGLDLNKTGDFTIIGKITSKNRGNFGLTFGNEIGDDVAWLQNDTNLNDSPFKISDEQKPENTFRIFRHDWGHAPVSLLEAAFDVELPNQISSLIQDTNISKTVFPVQFLGTGYGASGTLDLSSYTLTIINGGVGFSDNPRVQVLDDNNHSIISLDPSWIRTDNGSDFNQTAVLRNLADRSPRGLRGLALPAGDFGPRGLQNDFLLFPGIGLPENLDFTAYFLEYRSDIFEHGIFVHLGTKPDSTAFGFTTPMDDALLDMRMDTIDNFDDAPLLLGRSYSDYDADVHITPIAKGGTTPMDYLDVVVNIGTVDSGEAKAPNFTLNISNQFPEIGETVAISILPEDGLLHKYSYAWYLNENPLAEPEYLNQPTITRSFSEAGMFVIRVVVTDLKGGISSRNIIFRVGEYEKKSESMITGTVRSNNGDMQGARVEVVPAPLVEHMVDVVGDSGKYSIPDGSNGALQYRMDGFEGADLVLRRGEVHRFYFDRTTSDFPLSFFEKPDAEIPMFRIKMLVTPRVEYSGGQEPGLYQKPPKVTVIQKSGFANYLDHRVGTILDFQNGLLDDLNLPLVVQRPYAKSLLVDTTVDEVNVRPIVIDPETGIYTRRGGIGLSRTNTPDSNISRSSFWEDYIVDKNASVRAYVDGVGTISPVNSMSPVLGEHNFLKPSWFPRGSDPLPDLMVWGTGSTRSTDNPDGTELGTPRGISSVEGRVVAEPTDIRARRIVIDDQGAGWEPNSTMAVLHYPKNPIAYWTFDVHESQFDDASQARYQPSPGWNRPMSRGFRDHWSFDEESGDTYYRYDSAGFRTEFWRDEYVFGFTHI